MCKADKTHSKRLVVAYYIKNKVQKVLLQVSSFSFSSVTICVSFYRTFQIISVIFVFVVRNNVKRFKV